MPEGDPPFHETLPGRKVTTHSPVVSLDHVACSHSPLVRLPLDEKGRPTPTPTCRPFLSKVVRVDPDQTFTITQYAPPSRTGQKGLFTIVDPDSGEAFKVPHGARVWVQVRKPILDAGRVVGWTLAHNEGQEEAPDGYRAVERSPEGNLLKLEPLGAIAEVA